MERRVFLRNLGIFSLGFAASNYGFNPLNLQKDSKEIIGDILNKKENWENYSGFQVMPGREHLQGKGIEYIINSSKEILENDYLNPEGEITINLNSKLFERLYSPKPEYLLPFISETLKNFGYSENFLEASAVIEKNSQKQGLWYNEVGAEEGNQFSIPYFDKSKFLIYAEGERWGAKGKAINLIRSSPLGNKTKIKTNSFIDLEGTNFLLDIGIYLFGKTISKKAIEQLQESQKDLENFMKILEKNSTEEINQGDPSEKRA